MKWLEISVRTNSDVVDIVSEILTRFGANGVSIEDKSDLGKELTEITWDYVDENIISNEGIACVRAYYLENTNKEEIVKSIDEALIQAGKYLNVKEFSIETKYVNDQDWQNEWKKYYKPIKIGKSIVVKPSWENPFGKGYSQIPFLNLLWRSAFASLRTLNAH